MFGLPTISDLHTGCRPPFLTDDSLLLVNARSGIFLLVERLAPAQVWMPTYLCGSMLQAVDARATRIRFYPVNADLVVPSRDWLVDVQPGDLVILVDYFGFPCDSSCAILAKEQGAVVLEDACQALLSATAGQFSDFALFSPRKFLGVPDGGILTRSCEVDFPRTSAASGLHSPPAEWWLKALSATILRREFDMHGGSRRWFERSQRVEKGQPVGHYAMSELSRMLLMHGFDYPAIAQRRVENYKLLADKLGDSALFPSLSPGVVPLGFPIRVQNRDRIRRMLFAHEIYPPLHWPIQGLVPQEFKDSHQLSAEIMTLPCDQRYSTREMNAMAQFILQELSA